MQKDKENEKYYRSLQTKFKIISSLFQILNQVGPSFAAAGV